MKMFHVHFSSTLIIVLVNVLAISCGPIYPASSQLNKENLEKKMSVDGLLYNPNPTDKGPLPAEIFDIYPKLVFLGNFNTRHWYIERTTVSYPEAVENCYTMGMSIARATQAELNFLYSVTLVSDDFAWVGASVPMALNSFLWENYDTYPTATRFEGVVTLALTASRYENNSALRPMPSDTRRYYFCTL